MKTLVFFADRDLRPVGDPVRWAHIDAVRRFNEPGRGSVTCAARPEVMEHLTTPGRRVVLVDEGEVFLAGPLERPLGRYGWEVGSGPGEVTFHFADDLASIVARKTYPDPNRDADQQTTVERWTQTGLAGAVMLSLVNANAGPGALAYRRVPHLVMGSGALLGSTVTWGSRFQSLGDELRALAIAGGGLGFRTIVDGGEIVFEVHETRDLSRSVRFSRGLGNLRSVSLETEAPRVTSVIVAGQGEGTTRTIVERTNASAEADWGRLEGFLDRRQAEDTAELEQAGDEALAEGGERARLATVTIDTPTQQYGEHYQLGDRVAVEPVPGMQVVDVVRAVHLQAWPKRGRLLSAMVGSEAMSSDPEWLRQSRALGRRLAELETI